VRVSIGDLRAALRTAPARFFLEGDAPRDVDSPAKLGPRRCI